MFIIDDKEGLSVLSFGFDSYFYFLCCLLLVVVYLPTILDLEKNTIFVEVIGMTPESKF